ncbi:MAG: O-antigen ligase family protein [Burkholderiales bacterium]
MALWIAVAIGLSLPLSTALDSVLLVALLVAWAASGSWREKLALLRRNAFIAFPVGLFLLQVAGSVYSLGSGEDIRDAVTKAATLLFIPLLVSLQPDDHWRRRALAAFAAAMLVTLALSFPVWWGLIPQGDVFKGLPVDAVVFKKKITHSVFMAYAAFVFALQAREARGPHRRWLFAALALVASFNVLFMVQSRTGQVVLAGLLLYFLYSTLRWRGLVVAAVAGIGVAGAAALLPASVIHIRTLMTIHEVERWEAGKPADASNLRLEAWSNSVRIWRRHPVVGTGTGGFPAAYASEIRGSGRPASTNPENQYLYSAVELGAVGVAALLALFAAQWRLAGRLATRTDIDLARGLVILMVLGCLFNSFLHDHAESLFYVWLSGLLFAGLQTAPRLRTG